MGAALAQELTHLEEGKRYMKQAGGACVALRRVGQGFACSIYAQRPDACRALLRGSAACLEERLLKLRVARPWIGPPSEFEQDR